MTFLDAPAAGTPVDEPAALARPDDLVGALGRFLQRIHRADPPAGAEVADVAWFVDRARSRVEVGSVDVDALDPPYRPHGVTRVLEIATELAATVVARAVVEPAAIHGSLALADLRIAGGEIVGWAVPERPLVGDPYVDIVFLARELATTIGPGAVPALFDAAGVERPDPLRVELWVTLAQFR